MSIKNIFKLLIVTFIVFVFSYSFTKINEVTASEQKYFDLKSINISKGTNHLRLTWNEIEGVDEYVIKYKNKTIYRGSNKDFLHEDLDEGSLHEYNIIALDKDDHILDNVYTKAFTPVFKKDNDYTEIGIDAVTNHNSILLKWPSIDNNLGYELYRNEEYIGKITDNFYLDDNLNTNTDYEYTIRTKVKLFSFEVHNRKMEMLESYNEMIDKEFDDLNEEEAEQVAREVLEEINKEILELENNPYEYIEISTPVQTTMNQEKLPDLKSFENELTLSSRSSPKNTRIRINTMILNKRSGPAKDRKYFKQPGRNYYFSSDNRTTIGATGNTRSKLTANIRWSDRRVTQSKSIGLTKRYKKNKKGNYVFHSDKRASSNGVYFGVTKRTKSMVDINFKHSAKNPFTTLAPSIKYEFRSEIYRDGTTKIRGYHTLFPSLGIFRNDGSGYKRIYSHNQGNRTPFSLFATKSINIVRR